MAFDPTNTITIGKNKNPRDDRSADYTGTVNIEGQEYWVNLWVREGKDGNKFMGGSVKPKEARGGGGGGGSRSAPSRNDSISDDIPF